MAKVKGHGERERGRTPTRGTSPGAREQCTAPESQAGQVHYTDVWAFMIRLAIGPRLFNVCHVMCGLCARAQYAKVCFGGEDVVSLPSLYVD